MIIYTSDKKILRLSLLEPKFYQFFPLHHITQSNNLTFT